MSEPGPEPPFEVRYSAAAAAVVSALPRPVRRALGMALREVASAPMHAGEAYDTRWPPEFRVITFDGGMVAYIVSERRKMVLVDDVVWTG